MNTQSNAYIQAATSFVHCLHILLRFLYPGGNHAFDSSNGTPWPIEGLDFGQITPIIVNDFPTFDEDSYGDEDSEEEDVDEVEQYIRCRWTDFRAE